MGRLVEDVFVTEGVPTYTFVHPPNFDAILLDVRRPGKPVIIEGQSGTGKTTCARKILEQLGRREVTFLSARSSTDKSIIENITENSKGTFVIDDFHRLDPSSQERLADLAKIAAEATEPRDDLKLILIGINRVGTSLIHLIPDIAKRTGIHRIEAGSRDAIVELINAGARELNVSIAEPEKVYAETRGDYWLTQQFCQSMCSMNGVLETCEARTRLDFDPDPIRRRVVERLKNAYYPAVKEFCRGRRFRKSNDPYYRLLRAVAKQGESAIDLNTLSAENSQVRGSINNIKEKRLSVLIEGKPLCSQHFYYDSETKNFAIEDPAMFFFIQHLDWDSLRQECGFESTNTADTFEYDFAVSFAGENRALAKEITTQLEALDACVFYDENYEVNVLGKTWSKEFERIFGRSSRLVVALLDEHYSTNPDRSLRF